MLKAHREIMTSCRLGLENAANLDEVLSIKLPLKHFLSIFAITNFYKPRWQSKMTSLAQYR